VPDGHDPDDFLGYAVKEPAGCHDDLPMREIGELWDAAA
jgi:hypothetical protein